MAAEQSLDLIDVALLRELQTDADRPNVELARTIGLSPAATLHRVRRLKESGVIDGVRARVDPTAAGFPLQVYVSISLTQHDERSHSRFQEAMRRIPHVIGADWVSGADDAVLQVVARDVNELQRVLMLFSRAGAQRVLTSLRLEQMKPPSPLPLRLDG